MRYRIYILAILIIVAAYIQGCRKDPPSTGTDDDGITTIDTVVMTPYQMPQPTFYPPAQIPEDNKMYLERIDLGKRLFFDTRLSNDGSACASCHKQELGFGDDKLSVPDKGLTSLPLINLAWYKNFMWNSRIIGTLEDVMLSEVTVRFQTDMAKINDISEYRVMFKKYYNVDDITAKDLSYALAQYMRTLVSQDTKYDVYFKGQGALSPQEERGRKVFFSEATPKGGGGDCFHCHVAVFATDNVLHNTGLDSTYAKEIDKGYYNVSKNPADLGKFRTPTLRNVALRPLYMHDGRFKTLEEVIDFYDHGINFVSNIDPLMTKPDKIDGLHLTTQDKKDLIAFLHTLTDSTMIANPDFVKP